ncbi:hypothetical protein LUZ60_004354 [Juncus effusus]|nr:hypothetical protein LUZ60_004354 [Juncus effusus]
MRLEMERKGELGAEGMGMRLEMERKGELGAEGMGMRLEMERKGELGAELMRGEGMERERELGAELRVLVVDDSPIDRRVVEGLLKRNGDGFIKVIAVDSGKKAIEFLGLNKTDVESPTTNDINIDIILTDYCMPEMTGYELLKAVKKQSFSKPIPVVVMSSENEPQRISRCRADGAEDFLLKPLKTNDVQRIRNYANKPSISSKIKSSTKKRNPSQLALSQETNILEKKLHFARFAMVLKRSNFEITPYFSLVCKLVLLAYALLCLSHLLRI